VIFDRPGYFWDGRGLFRALMVKEERRERERGGGGEKSAPLLWMWSNCGIIARLKEVSYEATIYSE